ncbi:MAG: DUF1934 domain-containing protein [Lachnospiraceae bacterium]|nr:DUF1934 domain-containing protein [Lachnospiraceae bacterium]
MTKDVLISIKGLHSVRSTDPSGTGEDDEVEVISPGKYYFRNGKHYIEYEEPAQEGEDGMAVKSLVTLRGRRLEVIRRGIQYSKMVFEENTKSESWYMMPAGSVLAGFDVKQMQVSVSDELIEILVDYALEFNCEPVSQCSVRIRVIAKDSGLFHLT